MGKKILSNHLKILILTFLILSPVFSINPVFASTPVYSESCLESDPDTVFVDHSKEYYAVLTNHDDKVLDRLEIDYEGRCRSYNLNPSVWPSSVIHNNFVSLPIMNNPSVSSYTTNYINSYDKFSKSNIRINPENNQLEYVYYNEAQFDMVISDTDTEFAIELPFKRSGYRVIFTQSNLVIQHLNGEIYSLNFTQFSELDDLYSTSIIDVVLSQNNRYLYSLYGTSNRTDYANGTVNIDTRPVLLQTDLVQNSTRYFNFTRPLDLPVLEFGNNSLENQFHYATNFPTFNLIAPVAGNRIYLVEHSDGYGEAGDILYDINLSQSNTSSSNLPDISSDNVDDIVIEQQTINNYHLTRLNASILQVYDTSDMDILLTQNGDWYRIDQSWEFIQNQNIVSMNDAYMLYVIRVNTQTSTQFSNTLIRVLLILLILLVIFSIYWRKYSE